MAKDKTTATPKVADPSKSSKGAKKFTDAELEGTKKGRLLLVLRKAYAIANNAGWKGIKEKETLEYPAGSFYGAVKPKGAYWKLSEESDNYKNLAAAAKAAFADINDNKWSASVQKLVMLPLGPGGGGGGGSKQLNKVLDKKILDF